MYNNYNLKQKTFFQKKEIVHYVVTTNRINFNRKVSDTYEVIMYYPFLLFQYEWMYVCVSIMDLIEDKSKRA